MSLDPDLETMRRIGHRAVDRVVEHLSRIRDVRVITPPDAAVLDRAVAEPLPLAGQGIEACIDRFFDQILPLATRVDHPRFFAYIPGPGSFAGAIGSWLAGATNSFVGSWIGGSVMTRLEIEVLDWLRQAVGLPAELGTGILTTGGSMANLVALAAARERGDPGQQPVVYASEEAHYSVAKAARILGIGCVHAVPTDGELRLDTGELRKAIAADRAAGRTPLVVVATAGTTNTAAVDPLPELAELCEQQSLWLHVDAAYGAAAGLLDEQRHLLEGWQRADSVTLDPHKWFYCPFECGALLTRHRDSLEQAFAADGSYMQDVPRDQVNFFTRGPELTRGNRALKLWMVLRSHGVHRIAEMVSKDIALCRLAGDLLTADARIELVTPPCLSMLTFAIQGGEKAGRALFDALCADGYTMLSTSRVGGRFVLRFCVVNHRTTEEDIRSSVARIRSLM